MLVAVPLLAERLRIEGKFFDRITNLHCVALHLLLQFKVNFPVELVAHLELRCTHALQTSTSVRNDPSHARE